jgi:hypothetical protein
VLDGQTLFTAASNIARLKLADSSSSRSVDSRVNKLQLLALLDEAEAVIQEGGPYMCGQRVTIRAR